MSKKYDCIFLDRDGTINIDPGYISKLQDFKFFDFAFAALDMLKTLCRLNSIWHDSSSHIVIIK